MTDPFTMTIQRLKNTGFFEFLLPFMLTAAIFYGLLRKSQIFGPPEKNVTVNGIIALTAAFMVWSYPILAGVSFSDKFPMFFVQAMSAMLVVLVSLLIISMFVPQELPKMIMEKLGNRLWIIIVFGLLVGGGIFVSSGLVNLFLPPGGTISFGGIPDDVVTTIAILGLFFITIFILVWGGGEKKGG